MEEQPHRLQAINQTTLTLLVCQALGNDALVVTNWRAPIAEDAEEGMKSCELFDD